MVIDGTRLLVRLLHRRRGSEAPETGPTIGTTDRGALVCWPKVSPERAGHVLVLGASGSGKTILVAHAIVREFLAQTDQEPGLTAVVVDPKGDLVVAILQALAALAPQYLGRVVYLDPFSGGFYFNLNRLQRGATPLDIRAQQLAGLVALVSTAAGAQAHLGTGSRQQDVLAHVLLGALAVEDPRASPLLALDSLVLPNGMKRLAALTRSPRARLFLEHTHRGDELRASTAARLRLALAASDDLARIMCAPDCLQFDDVLAPGRLVLVGLGEPTGGLLALSRFWANVLVRLALDHLLQRTTPWLGHHVRIVIEEVQLVAEALGDIGETVATTGRSRGLSIVTITQGTELVRAAAPDLLRVLFTNAPTRLIGRLSAPDAELLAREISAAAGTEEPLGAVRSAFVSRVTNLPDRTFYRLTPGGRERFTSAPVDVAAWAAAARAHAEAITAAKAAYRLPAATGPRVTLDDLVPPKPRVRRPAGPRSRWG